MFLGKTIFVENETDPQLFRENLVQPGVQEIHIEIVGESARHETSPNQVHSITSLYEYFTDALKEESPPVEQLKCYYCEEKYLCFQSLYNHAYSKHKDSVCHPLKCFICQQLFVFTKEYHNHLIFHHQRRNPEALCNVCLTCLPNCEALTDHMSSHQADYSCGNCSTKFFSQDHLVLHQQYHNCRKKLLCDICGITYQSKLLLGLHSLRHKQIECPLTLKNSCSSFSSEVELIHHFKENHPHDILSLLEIIERYDKEESSLGELLQSIPRINKKGQGLDFQSCLSKITLKQDVECITCSIKLSSVFQIWLHFLKNHLTSKKCPICEKHFKGTLSILIHLGSEGCEAVQESVTTLTCPKCGDSFDQKEELLDHQLTHVKPLQCSECNKSFQRKSELKHHLLDHGLPPKLPVPNFECPVCSSRWLSMTDLRRHTRTHANERPFQCEHCGATFKRQQALKVHFATAHSGQTYACSHCGNSCRSKQALFLHVCRVHVRLRRFVCGLCAKPWPQNQDLRRHLSKTHNLDYPPLTKSIALSSKEVHVIPPLENLAVHDPLRLKIANVIAEEKEKLRSLHSDFDPGNSTSKNTTDPLHKEADSPSQSTQQTDKIYLSCDFCDFRCEDFNSWIEHSLSHQQISLNSQASIPLEIVNVPIVPVEPIFVPPMIQTPAINYGTLVTVLPTSNPNNLTTINEPFATINPGLFQQQVVVPQPVETSVLPTQQEVITERADQLEIEENSCETDSGELININGMFVRIERFNGDASELMSKSTITFENAPYEKNDEMNAIEEPVGTPADDGDENECVSSEESNLTYEINENIEDIVKLANDGSGVEIDPSELIRLVGGSDIQSSQDKNAIWPCKQCGKVVSSFQNLQRHMRLHTGEKPFICMVCDKAFTEKFNLKIHMRSHTQEKPYFCPICGKNFRYFKDYTDHKKTHEGIKNYNCPVCGRSFVRQRELVRHQNIHSSERKYQCSICSKYFMRLDSLKIHMPQMHGAFPCTNCKRRFANQHELEHHQRNHSDPPRKKRVTCPICEKTFARNAGLKTHLQLHSNNKAHVVCYACPRKFRTMDAMLTHLGTFHKKWRDEAAEENQGIVDNCRISVQTQEAIGEVYSQNIEDVFNVNARKDTVIVLQ